LTHAGKNLFRRPGYTGLIVYYRCLGRSPKNWFCRPGSGLAGIAGGAGGAATLNKQIEAKQKEIEAKRQQIDAFQKELEKDFPKLNNAQRQEREAQLQSMIISLQQFQRQAQDGLNYQRNQILKNLQDQLVKVVSNIGRAGHYTVILNDKSVLYVNGAIDITPQVVAAMTDKANGKGVGAAK